MKTNECFSVFESKLSGFIKTLKQGLWQSAGVHFRNVSTPQSLMSFFVWDNDLVLQLRFVVIGLVSGRPVGRFSWLDQQGYDHVCCYVNDDFQCVTRKQSGVWREQKSPVLETCIRRFEEIKRAR